MAFIMVPDGALGVVTWQVGTESFSNTLGFVMPSFTLTDQEALASTLDASWGDAIRAYQSTDCFYVGTTVYDMRSSSAPIVLDNTHAAAGLTGGEALPVGLSLVLTHYTAKRGRTGRGRTYLSGFTEGQLEDGEWATLLATNVETTFATLKSQLQAVGWTPVVISRQENGVPRSVAVTTPIIQSAVRNNRPGYQRRRTDRP